MTAINTAIEVDMTGQVCADSIGYDFYSGIGGQVDFNRGAARAREGKAIVALPSTAKNGTISRIVPRLTEGAGVVTTRGDVHYVVTEYGIAHLFGKSIRERVMELATIAHPDFRNEILNDAKVRKYIYPDQKLPPPKSQYPNEYEQTRTLSDGTMLDFRPIKPTDDKMLRDMLYSLSERSIAFRFFKPIKAFPHRFIQEFTTVDYTKDMAVVAIYQDTGGERIVGVGRYFLDPVGTRCELSFLVRDDLQMRGMGSELLRVITEIARRRGLEGFDAHVLATNYNMLAVFYNSGLKISTKRVDDMYVISHNFKDE
jgi:GNAT superfamily N-acetyltransferase